MRVSLSVVSSLCVALWPAHAHAQSDGGGHVMEVEAFENAPDEVDAGSADAGSEGTAVLRHAQDDVASAPHDVPSALSDVSSESSEGPTVRVFSSIRGETMVDTAFESPRNSMLAENVAEGRFRANFGADVKLSKNFRAVLEVKGQVRLVTQQDFERPKGFFEAIPGDVFLDWYTSKADIRIGMQRIPLGANAGLAAIDALNPRDLRERILASEPEDAFLTTFAIRAQGEVGKLAWLAAYAPFFQSNRYYLLGQDEALLQPALAPAFDARRIDPSVEDFSQERAVESSRPPLFAGDVALHVNSTGKVKVGATWAWVNEKMPRVVVDAELASIASAQAAGKPVNAAATASVANRYQAGETLFRGNYLRQHIFAAQATALVGPAQIDADISYSPRQTFFDASFAPIDKSVVTVVLGVSQASDSKFVYSFNYMGLAVPDLASDQQLILVEPATAQGAPRTAFFHLLVGAASYPVWKERLELSLRAAFELTQLSFAVAPKVTWQGVDNFKLWISGEFTYGNQYSPFGYFSRNNKIVVGARYDFF